MEALYIHQGTSNTSTIHFNVLGKDEKKKHYYIYNRDQIGKTWNARMLPNSIFVDSWDNDYGEKINKADFIIFDEVTNNDSRVPWKTMKRLTEGYIRPDPSIFRQNVPNPHAQIVILADLDPCTLMSQYDRDDIGYYRHKMCNQDRSNYLSSVFRVYKPCGAVGTPASLADFDMVGASDPAFWSEAELYAQMSEGKLLDWVKVDLSRPDAKYAFIEAVRKEIQTFKRKRKFNAKMSDFLDIFDDEIHEPLYNHLKQVVHVYYDSNLESKKLKTIGQTPIVMSLY